MKVIDGKQEPGNARVGIVVSRFNESITSKLLVGASRELKRLGVNESNLIVVWVPGAHEIPVAARALASQHYDAVVALGCVVRGETAHFDFVAGECCRGLTNVSLEFGIPVTNGVLAVENGEQARSRAGGKKGNKGVEAAAAAIETLNVLKQL